MWGAMHSLRRACKGKQGKWESSGPQIPQLGRYRGAHHSSASPKSLGRAPQEAQGSQVGQRALGWCPCVVWYLQGLCCCCHHLGVWGEEAVHGSREEPG